MFLATAIENYIYGLKTMCCYRVQKSQDKFIIKKRLQLIFSCNLFTHVKIKTQLISDSLSM